MKIEAIGGEFGLIDRLSRLLDSNHPGLVQGIGDDAAVLRVAPEPAPYLLVTTDMLVEGQHFKSDWSGAEQIGFKASESNASDIAAMGGRPTWMFISLALRTDCDVEWAEGVYRGVAQSCRRHGMIVAGGDTTQGPVNTIGITLLGTVSNDHLCLRSQARPGELMAVTGTLGASAAALALLENNQKPSDYLLDKHQMPRCRLDVSSRIAALAGAMIDISDGLGSEVRHICRQSGVGVEIKADAVPLHPDVRHAGRRLNLDPLRFALTGGEDFELLFTIAPSDMAHLQREGISVFPIGAVTKKAGGKVLIQKDGRRIDLPGGYDHFR